MSLWLWIPVAFLLFGPLATIVTVGKPRKPLDGSTAAVVTVVNLVLVGCILKGGGVL